MWTEAAYLARPPSVWWKSTGMFRLFTLFLLYPWCNLCIMYVCNYFAHYWSRFLCRSIYALQLYQDPSVSIRKWYNMVMIHFNNIVDIKLSQWQFETPVSRRAMDYKIIAPDASKSIYRTMEIQSETSFRFGFRPLEPQLAHLYARYSILLSVFCQNYCKIFKLDGFNIVF